MTGNAGRNSHPFARQIHPWRFALHLILLGVLALWVYPFMWMLVTALRPAAEVAQDPLQLFPETFTFENFQRAWAAANFSRYLLNSVIVTLSSVALTVMLTALAGYALGRRSFPGRVPLLALLGMTIFLPHGYTVIPVYDLVTRLGLNNTLQGVILALSGTGFILYIFMFTAYFAGLPKEVEEAAVIDGANVLQVFFQVMLPLAGPIIATVAILEFMNSWNAFLYPLVLTLTRPDLRVLGVGMYSFFGEYGVDITGLMAAATISLIPVIAVFMLFQRYFVEGVAGAVKS